MTSHPYRRARRAAVAATLASTLALAGCATDDAPTESSDPKPSEDGPPDPDETPADPDETPADEADPGEEEVLESYLSYWVEFGRAAEVVDVDATDIEDYATREALGDVVTGVMGMEEAGHSMTGAPQATAPEVTALETDDGTPEATVEDCIDVEDWKVVDASGQEVPLPEERLVRYESTAQMVQWEGKWLVTEVEAHNTAC